jgi:hypothetical protein
MKRDPSCDANQGRNGYSHDGIQKRNALTGVCLFFFRGALSDLARLPQVFHSTSARAVPGFMCLFASRPGAQRGRPGDSLRKPERRISRSGTMPQDCVCILFVFFCLFSCFFLVSSFLAACGLRPATFCFFVSSQLYLTLCCIELSVCSSPLNVKMKHLQKTT